MSILPTYLLLPSRYLLPRMRLFPISPMRTNLNLQPLYFSALNHIIELEINGRIVDYSGKISFYLINYFINYFYFIYYLVYFLFIKVIIYYYVKYNYRPEIATKICEKRNMNFKSLSNLSTENR